MAPPCLAYFVVSIIIVMKCFIRHALYSRKKVGWKPCYCLTHKSILNIWYDCTVEIEIWSQNSISETKLHISGNSQSIPYCNADIWYIILMIKRDTWCLHIVRTCTPYRHPEIASQMAPYSGHMRKTIGLWSKVVHCIENRTPIGTHLLENLRGGECKLQ
jgi:hypothetical protein